MLEKHRSTMTGDVLRAWSADADAEIEALRKDAERYRFLRCDFSPMGLNINGQHAWAYRRNAALKGPTLDTAIDAAMAVGAA